MRTFRRLTKRSEALLSRSLREFLDDHCPELAAAIAYYALFSIFPVVILLAAVLGLVLGESEAREQVIGFITDNIPLGERGRGEIESLLRGVTAGSGAVGGLALVGVVYAASALMGAVRNSLNAVWGADDQRPFLRGKALDILLVIGIGVLIGLSLAATLVTGLTVDLAGDLGLDGSITGPLYDIAQFAIPITISTCVFTILFRFVPARRLGLSEIWPGILIATLGYELAKRGFTFYLENFASYSVIYGSLGAVIAFMVFVYVAAMVFLFGAQAAAVWPEVSDQDLDEPEEGDSNGEPLGKRITRFLKSLAVRTNGDRPDG